MDESALLMLVREYLRCVAQLSSVLARSYGATDLYSAWRLHQLPRRGTFGVAGQFQFHGIGCRIDDGTTCVDFDFLPDGGLAGFDAWRLFRFVADNRPAESPEGTELRAVIQLGLDRLLNVGLIERIPGSDLFRCREEVGRIDQPSSSGEDG